MTLSDIAEIIKRLRGEIEVLEKRNALLEKIISEQKEKIIEMLVDMKK